MVFVQNTSTNSRDHRYNTDEGRRRLQEIEMELKLSEVFTKTVYIISSKFDQSSIRLLNNLTNLVSR